VSGALVVFSGTAQIPWLRLLRRGFRHCFVLVPADGGWIALDPLAHRLAVGLVPPLDAAGVIAHYEALGCTVVPSPLREPPRRLRLFAPFTCVEAVKRVIGLDAPRVWTPWQLYRALSLCDRRS
jgi:hypothetical protein